MAAAQYAALAEQVVERPRSFPFGYFRLYYTGTMEYQPRAETITRQLLDHAYKIQTSQDPVEIAEALSAYEELVKNHLASIKVVLQALSLSRQDERFGDPEFLEWLRDGLFKSLLAESGQ